MTLQPALCPCPDALFDEAGPRVGTYAGRAGDTRLKLPEISWLRRQVSEKRWQWFAGFDEQLAVGGALVDAGWFGTVFCWVFDRTHQELLCDTDIVVPPGMVSVTTHPTVGHIASMRGQSGLTIDRCGDRLHVQGGLDDGTFDLVFTPRDERAITAVCPVAERDHGVNITQKEVGVPVTGRVEIGDAVRELDGEGVLDYSHGLLGRDTRWDWAIATGRADGTAVGFNLVDQFNDGRENVVWLDGQAHPTGGATLETERTAGAEHWHVQTSCGTVDATLTVAGRRRQVTTAVVVKSAYDQPLGRWTGTVGGMEFEGVGVAEDHHTRW